MKTELRELEAVGREHSAFTLVELFVVLATLLVLAAVLLPALAHTRYDSQAFQGLNNLRQITLGWTMYSAENNDKLALNAELAEQSPNPNDPKFQPGGAYSQWCPGRMDVVVEAWSNAWIKAGLVYPYVNNALFYHDPADHSTWPFNATYGHPRVRSISMNAWLNPPPGEDWNTIMGYSGANTLTVYRKQTDIKRPSQLFVLIDENPIGIDDGFFLCDPIQTNHWADAPATYHSNGGGLSYADGHSEIKVWHDRKLLDAGTRLGDIPADLNSQDLLWLQQRSTERVMSP